MQVKSRNFVVCIAFLWKLIGNMFLSVQQSQDLDLARFDYKKLIQLQMMNYDIYIEYLYGIKDAQLTRLCLRRSEYDAKLKYRHSLISAVSISAIFDFTRFITLSYFPPLQYLLLSNLDLCGFTFHGFFMCPHINSVN